VSHPEEPYSIFVVEDNPADVMLVREALSQNQLWFSLESYDTGEKALAALAKRLGETGQQLPHLVLLDWNLPTVDGSEVLRTIRSWPSLDTTPVAILTSSDSPRDRSEAFRFGASFFLQKPMNLDDFIQKVGGQLRDVLRNQARSSGAQG
jgi:CheY-like chemotaxis protein